MNQETQLIEFINKEQMIAVIHTQTEVDLCMEQNRRAKKMVDFAESMRIEATKPIFESKRKLDLLWKARTAPLLALISHNKTNLEAYLFEQEKQKAEELKNFDFNKKESTNLAKIEVKAEAGVTYRTDWDLEITDISIVPEKFIIKTLDEKAIKDHLKNGGTVVKGVKITPKKIIITK